MDSAAYLDLNDAACKVSHARYGISFHRDMWPSTWKCMIWSPNLSESNLDVCDDYQNAWSCANADLREPVSSRLL